MNERLSAAQPALIINGDDFGQSESVNRAIIEAHEQGVLTSASLMVNEDAANDAVAKALETSGLKREVSRLKQQQQRSAFPENELFGNSPAMQETKKLIKMVSQTPRTQRPLVLPKQKSSLK